MTPHDYAAENMVLAMIVNNPKRFFEARALGLKPVDFFDSANAEIYRDLAVAIETKPDAGITDLMIAVGREHKDRLVAFWGNSAGTANLEYYVREITNASLHRKGLLTVSGILARLKHMPSSEIKSNLSGEIAKLRADLESEQGLSLRPAKQILESAIGEIEETIKRQKEGSTIGIPSDFIKLDENIYGWQPGQLYIVGARPGVGKTTLCQNFALSAVKRGHRVSFFALEMRAEDLIKKFIAMEAGVGLKSILTGDLNDYQLGKITDATQVIHNLPLDIGDKSSITFEEMISEITIAKERDQTELIIIDYLTLIRTANQHESFQKMIAHITKTLKSTAKDLKLPIILACQLKREYDQSGGRRPPRLSDLKESGSIEQDADACLFIDRPHMYNEKEPENLAYIHLQKNRFGETGAIPLKCNMALGRFFNE